MDLGKGVFRLRNPTTGLLLKKSVNACRLKPYRKKKQWPPLRLGNKSLFQTGSPSSSFNNTKGTGKRPRLLESDSEIEEPSTDESVPPLPPPMPTLKQLQNRAPSKKKLKISSSFFDNSSHTPEHTQEHEQCSPDDCTCMSPLRPPMPSLNHQLKTSEPFPRGFASSTLVLDGGYYPDFFPMGVDAPSPILGNAAACLKLPETSPRPQPPETSSRTWTLEHGVNHRRETCRGASI